MCLVDVFLAVELQNREKVIQLFANNNIQYIEADHSAFDGSESAQFAFINREYADVDLERNLLLKNRIQYSTYNDGVYGEVDEQMINFRIVDGKPAFETIDFDTSKITYTDLDSLISKSSNLEDFKQHLHAFKAGKKIPVW